MRYNNRKIIICTAGLFLAVTIVFLWTRVWETTSNHELSQTETKETNEQSAANPQGFTHEGNQYRNTTYGFSFALPSMYIARSNSLGDDSEILTFDDGQKHSFQIFITSHDEPLITPERIKLDVPDMVINDVRTATLDGVDALLFKSFDASLGETYEVWFIYKNHLYQIMTYTKQESELNTVLDSWKFI